MSKTQMMRLLSFKIVLCEYFETTGIEIDRMLWGFVFLGHNGHYPVYRIVLYQADVW